MCRSAALLAQGRRSFPLACSPSGIAVGRGSQVEVNRIGTRRSSGKVERCKAAQQDQTPEGKAGAGCCRLAATVGGEWMCRPKVTGCLPRASLGREAAQPTRRSRAGIAELGAVEQGRRSAAYLTCSASSRLSVLSARAGIFSRTGSAWSQAVRRPCSASSKRSRMPVFSKMCIR